MKTIEQKLRILKAAHADMLQAEARYDEAEALVYAGRMDAKNLQQYSDAKWFAVDRCANIGKELV